MDNQLYQQELLDHYRRPRNCGTLDGAHVTTQTLNPSCGDEISLQVIIEAGLLKKVAFQGKGCVISQAAASMLTQKSVMQSIAVIENYTKEVMLSLVGIPLGPTRLRCALLSLEALHEAIALHKGSMHA